MIGGPGTYVLGPRVVAAGNKVHVVYAAEYGGNWDIYTVDCSTDGPGKPLAVTSHSAVDVDAGAAWHDGTLWVAWESNRDNARRIFLAAVRDGKV